MTPEQFAGAVRQYCLALGGSVTSWGRTPARNAAVGGDRRSLHLAWKAADVTYDAHLVRHQLSLARARLGETWNPAPMPALEEAAVIAARLGLYVHREGDHDHVRPLDEVWT
jgi:Peptidase M15